MQQENDDKETKQVQDGRNGTQMETISVPKGGLVGSYAQREAWLRKQEEQGELRFVVIQNDKTMQNMKWYVKGDVEEPTSRTLVGKRDADRLQCTVERRLVGLKGIFSRQLPNMPKEYIVRLVLDRGHKSLVILKGMKVIGGITYRPFYKQNFGEIAFCAVTSQEQVRGYGTRLMNKLKEHCKSEGLTHFLTYADNNAVGYFAKQGFTKEIYFEREKWVGYIKDYDGGTLMECALHNSLFFSDFPEIIRRQREAVDGKVREMSNSHVVLPGLACFRDPTIKKPIKIEDIPGVKEAGWVPETSPRYLLLLPGVGPVLPTKDKLHNFMRVVYKAIIEHEDAWPFIEPVRKEEVPDYYEIIKDPIHLTLIGTRISSEEYYINLEMFAADLKRMFNNCRIYNSPETPYVKCANRLEAFFEHKINSSVSIDDPGLEMRV